MGKLRIAFKICIGKSEEKKPLGRPRRRWEDTIKMGLWEIGLEGMDWIDLAQDRDWWWALVNMVIQLSDFIRGGKFLG
jgi:hypothetical protein